ncbi:Receptor, ligand binding region [Sesbania bispinosa]|nr:Receptor, ligand binding region [Sesbania bispinosa]
MMETGYVWIITDPFTSLVHSLNASTISSMQGIIGVKSYFPETGHQYEDFYLKFRQKFSLENPQEFNNEPGIFAVHAYDAAWTVALAMSQTNSKGGQVLLDKILVDNFTDLSGKKQFNDQKLAPLQPFQIINVMGKGYKEIGFWSDGYGFSKDIGPNATYNCSMKELGQVFVARKTLGHSKRMGPCQQVRNSNAVVGYGAGSFLRNYLQEVLQFHHSKIRQFSELEEYAEALRRREIAAAFLEVSCIQNFPCKAFPKGSPILPSVNKVLLDLFETGKVRELESKMLASEQCEDIEPDGETSSLSPNSSGPSSH